MAQGGSHAPSTNTPTGSGAASPLATSCYFLGEKSLETTCPCTMPLCSSYAQPQTLEDAEVGPFVDLIIYILRKYETPQT